MINQFLTPETTLILGQNRSGKSVLLKMIFFCSMYSEKRKIIFFDIFNSCKNTTLCLGGNHIDPESDMSMGFAFLQHLPPEQACVFLCFLLEHEGIHVTHDVKSAILSAVHMLKALDTAQHTLTNLIPFVQDVQAQNALSQYTRDHGYTAIFDAEHDVLDLSIDLTCIESKYLFESDIGPLILLYIFLRIESAVKKHHFAIIFDDASLALSSPFVVKKLHTWINNLKKHNVFMIFALHQLSDITPELKEVLLNHTSTKILTPNPLADSNEVVEKSYMSLGLTSKQIHALSIARVQRDYMILTAHGDCQIIDLMIEPNSVSQAILGGSNIDDINLMQELIDRHGSKEAIRQYLTLKTGKFNS